MVGVDMSVEEKIHIVMGESNLQHPSQCPRAAINQYSRTLRYDHQTWRSPF